MSGSLVDPRHMVSRNQSFLTLPEGFPGGAVVKNPPANAGDVRDMGSVPGSGRSRGEGNGNPLQYSCLENLMDRGACRLHGLVVSRVGHDLARSEERRVGKEC